MASEESKTKVEVISVSEKELPDDMSKEDFAARVMDAIFFSPIHKQQCLLQQLTAFLFPSEPSTIGSHLI